MEHEKNVISFHDTRKGVITLESGNEVKSKEKIDGKYYSIYALNTKKGKQVVFSNAESKSKKEELESKGWEVKVMDFWGGGKMLYISM